MKSAPRLSTSITSSPDFRRRPPEFVAAVPGRPWNAPERRPAVPMPREAREARACAFRSAGLYGLPTERCSERVARDMLRYTLGDWTGGETRPLGLSEAENV
jgi:hypothetical protein